VHVPLRPLASAASAAAGPPQVRRGPRGGRIPGAVSLPRGALVSKEEGRLLPLDEQRRVLEGAGVVPPGSMAPSCTAEVVLYCNGGVAACTAALALQRLGHRRWAVYDGSWNEWSAQTDLPVEG
jgi:thiosulfate/3-mercaptopyruvate sulfurtransferase